MTDREGKSMRVAVFQERRMADTGSSPLMTIA